MTSQQSVKDGVFALPRGAQISYRILGFHEHIGRRRPLVIINGMNARWIDWDMLTVPLSNKRPILLFDHRDFGASISSTSQREAISIESMANDAIALIKSLGWNDVDACGMSMGGVILQQILVTPNLPFTVSHAILAVTTAKPPHGDPEFLEINKARATQPKPTTHEQKIEAARPTLELMYDKKWVVENRDKIDAKLPSLIFGRPPSVAGRQAHAVATADLRKLIPTIPSSVRVLVIHGTLDRIVHYSESEYILRGIKHARRVAVDGPRGVPTDAYGHAWYEYFDIPLWVGILEGFLEDKEEGKDVKARL